MPSPRELELPLGIVLRYKCQDGTERQERYDDNVTDVSLIHRNITSIDLAPLSSCTALRRLELNDNRIQRLDLTPLSRCTDLRVLYLWGNPLGRIDLTPIKYCTELRELGLSRSNLEAIDLSPLGNCRNLQTIGLWLNKIRTIDLGPLSTCTALKGIWVNQNPLEELDVTPLVSCLRLRKIGVPARVLSTTVLARETLTLLKSRLAKCAGGCEAPPSKTNMASVPRVMSVLRESERPWTALVVAQNVLSVLGFLWVGFLEECVQVVENAIANPASTKDIVLDALYRQLDRGGTSIGLDLNAAADEHGLAVRVPKVLERRKQEIEEVSVSKARKKVNLRPLWLTAYGNMILTAAGLGTTCTTDSLDSVVDAVKQMGFELKVTKCDGKEQAGVLPQLARQYIWTLADNRQKKHHRK